MKSKVNIIIPGLMLVLLLSGLNSCKLYKEAPASNELVEETLPTDFLIPENWTTDSYDTAQVNENWYLEFEDPLLNDYIEQALDTTNPGVVYRIAKIQQRLAEITLAKSGRHIQMNYGINYMGDFTTQGMSHAGGIGLPISWEADLWGRLKVGVLAANEQMLSEVQQYEYTRQSIAGNVSRLYFQTGAVKQSLAIGEEFRDINERLIEVQEAREEIGISDSKDTHLAKANVANIEAIIKEYENQLQELTRMLEILLGNYPENDLAVEWQEKDLTEIVTVEDPLSLISRRPDLKALESQVKGAFYLSEQARLAKYPSLVLSAASGFTVGGLGISVGSSLLGPIFNGKAIRSKIEIANAEQKQILALYGSAILEAFKEVESNLNSEMNLRDQLAFSIEVAEESRKAYEIAVEQYKVGQQDLYSTLLLQGQYLLAKLKTTDIISLSYLQRIQLHLSLGGSIN